MPVVKLEPTDAYPMPYSVADEEAKTFLDEISITATTAELLEQLGAPLEVSEEDLKREAKMLDEAIREKKVAPLRNQITATAARAFLQTYGQNLAFDVAQVRAAITHKLLEIADCGDTKYELKALEMLGKHSDVGLFTDRSEITINYNSPEALEKAIRERVKRLLNADVIDMKPLGMDLDEELGIMDADFSEVLDEEEEVEGETEE